MARVGQDFALKQGDDCTIAIRVTDAAGEPVSLSGAQIEWRIAKYAYGPAQVVKSLADGVTLGEETVGGKTYALVQVDLSAAETAGITPSGSYYYECRVAIGERRSTIVAGPLGVWSSPTPTV